MTSTHIRIVTAASLFDGHDASINMIRRLLQDAGAEVIHLGHNRSVRDVVQAVLQEGAHGVALSSYQGGHMEYFKYAKDLLVGAGAPYVKIFGGGGGVIIHEEKRALEAYGITRVFHPDDGRRLGLDGMIREIIDACKYDLFAAANSAPTPVDEELGLSLAHRKLGLLCHAAESGMWAAQANSGRRSAGAPLVIGVTGTGGAGKSSLIDELVLRFKSYYPDLRIGVVCVDPSKRKSGGALLGDRIRMNALSRPGVFMRSVASRGSLTELSAALPSILDALSGENFDVLIAESSGIGQAQDAIRSVADVSLYVMTSEFGAASQLEKIEMLDVADWIAINKGDRRGAEDAARDVRKQVRRSRPEIFRDTPDEAMPVTVTRAQLFNDEGCNRLFQGIIEKLCDRDQVRSSLWSSKLSEIRVRRGVTRRPVVPPERQNYLAEATHAVRRYKKQTEEMACAAEVCGAAHLLNQKGFVSVAKNSEVLAQPLAVLGAEWVTRLENWTSFSQKYSHSELIYSVRGREVRQPLEKKSLSGLSVRRVSVPKLASWGDRLRYMRLENVPGEFPYTGGVFPLKREGEDPTRMFAGEGPPERTNRRFHYLAKGSPATRLSTAFDSVTLYGEDPAERPDIFGKVGESGVSICTLEDMRRLYHGFDLLSPSTSVSMTINGPAPVVLAFFLNTAIDQAIDAEAKRLGRALTKDEALATRRSALEQVRGTVQADILKEDQGQNTCIFSIDFALKMMGDIQEYFIEHRVRNFYSVSISGYHIAEAGANPISQLAFTLSNALTYVEYYISRGMKIDEFAPNLSFFFSNGLDAEYSVLGRVARRIWAIVIRDLYGGDERSQKLKYHIQTSGRSLHAQEIEFNDIRTTLQALIATYDHCNSLHTNAFDEAITTPTESSVRRAMAIQMIIQREFGPAVNENSNQGSYFFEELTDLVEEAVLEEFLRISERGGVLGAMETQYQRGKIQEESMLYERLKHSGELPIIGVNTFIDPLTLTEGYEPPKIQLARASQEEKALQFRRVGEFQSRNAGDSRAALTSLKEAVWRGENVFAVLMDVARTCSLGQVTEALYEAGGQYRRNI